MVSGEYCTFSAFSTMVSRLALAHLTINYLNNNDFSPLLISTRLHVKALGPNLPRAPTRSFSIFSNLVTSSRYVKRVCQTETLET